MAQQQESLQFYKIQVMEKDREIADFTAKMKKVEFKHNRDLKEAKIGKQRAEALLKDEKAKSDKYSRAAQENAHQNQLLELRLAELKREKERELSEVYAKYNTLKEEVRSYERILPTFTFLNDLALTIPQLPNYEHIFLALKEKTNECEQLIEKHRQAEAEWEETLRSCKASEEALKTKRVEAEKNLKEVLAKMMQQEHQMSELRLHNDALAESVAQLEEELQLARERCESLEESIRDYETKIERLAEEFEAELASKEEEAYRASQCEMAQIEEELQHQQTQFERKEAAFGEQIRLLEEEVAYLGSKYQAEIDTFEEHYLTIKQETERMRAEITHQKRRYDELQERYNESISSLTRVATFQEQAQERNRLLEQKMALQEQQRARENRTWEEGERNRTEQLQREHQEALQKLTVLGEHYSRLEEERDQLQEQNFLLRQELSNAQMQRSQSNNFFLQLPKNAQEERLRKKSSQMEPFSLPSFAPTDTTRVKELQQELALLKKRSEIDLQRYSQAERRVSYFESENIKLKKEAEEHRKERERLQGEKEKLQGESIALKERIIHLTRTNNQHEMAAYGNSTKNKLEKTKLEAVEEEIKHLQEDNKREKQTIRKLKEEAKTIKEAAASESDRLAKQIKDLHVQVEAGRIQKEKLAQQLHSKQKSCSHQSALLKNSKELEQILKQQIQQLQLQQQQTEIVCQQLQFKLDNSKNEIVFLGKEVEKLETSLKQAQRENELANQCLDRQRKERSLLTVPSLHSISEEPQEQSFNQIYATIPLKEGEIHLLQRQMMDLREEMETLRLTQQARVEAMEAENNHYVQTIIQMKMRCAESQMKASQKQYLYSQLKKRAAASNIILK